MLKKNLKKIEKRRNKKEKDWKEAAEKQRVLPRSRQMKNVNEKKNGKTIIGYMSKFSVQKNLTFSGQKKITDTIEKIANKLAKTLKRIVPLKFCKILLI